jgi:hypothetical protein
MTGASHEDRLVTLLQAKTEFEANMTVAVLADAGIEAFAFGGAYGALPLSSRLMRVPVQVRESDLDAAKAALASNVSDSVDLDWDEVDVGEREDGLPLRTPGRMPLAAKIAYGAAVAILILTVVAFLAVLFT